MSSLRTLETSLLYYLWPIVWYNLPATHKKKPISPSLQSAGLKSSIMLAILAFSGGKRNYKGKGK
jgi:hypothetical protein